MRTGRGVYESMRYLEIFEQHSFVSACNSWFRTSTEVIALFGITRKRWRDKGNNVMIDCAKEILKRST
jgi:hypothetical protein